jgi:TfoX/Sxy family transcriptional regulator of competence genes
MSRHARDRIECWENRLVDNMHEFSPSNAEWRHVNDQDLLACVRASLAGTRAVSEIKMFGGIGFMLNGNLLVAASSRGMLARVGKDAEREALAQPGATPMMMRGRLMAGYIRVDASALDERAVESWIHLARRFVQTLPKKKPARNAGRSKTKLTR